MLEMAKLILYSYIGDKHQQLLQRIIEFRQVERLKMPVEDAFSFVDVDAGKFVQQVLEQVYVGQKHCQMLKKKFIRNYSLYSAYLANLLKRKFAR